MGMAYGRHVGRQFLVLNLRLFFIVQCIAFSGELVPFTCLWKANIQVLEGKGSSDSLPKKHISNRHNPKRHTVGRHDCSCGVCRSGVYCTELYTVLGIQLLQLVAVESIQDFLLNIVGRMQLDSWHANARFPAFIANVFQVLNGALDHGKVSVWKRKKKEGG